MQELLDLIYEWIQDFVTEWVRLYELNIKGLLSDYVDFASDPAEWRLLLTLNPRFIADFFGVLVNRVGLFENDLTDLPIYTVSKFLSAHIPAPRKYGQRVVKGDDVVRLIYKTLIDGSVDVITYPIPKALRIEERLRHEGKIVEKLISLAKGKFKFGGFIISKLIEGVIKLVIRAVKLNSRVIAALFVLILLYRTSERILQDEDGSQILSLALGQDNVKHWVRKKRDRTRIPLNP